MTTHTGNGFIPYHFSKKSGKGFTLIETLVAISVLLVSIAGPLTIASKSLTSALFARDQVTSFYLAQEGVEFVRNWRDNNALTSSSWLTGLSNCISPNTCSVDPKNNTVTLCPAGVCPRLKYDSASGFYNTQTGTNSIFTRSITISQITGDEYAIASKISWTSGLFPKTFQVRDNIYNWAGSSIYAQGAYYSQSSYYSQGTYYSEGYYQSYYQASYAF